MQEAGLRLLMAEAQTSLEIARAKGDERAAREATNRMRQLEIELAQLQAKALRAEAEATLEMVKVKREELKARGELTAAAEAELKATELAAQAKKVQADIADEAANRLMKVKQATDSLSGSTRDATGNIDGLSRSLGGAADNAERLAAGMERTASGNLYNKDKFWSDPSGNAIEISGNPDPWRDAQSGDWFFTNSDGQTHRSHGQPIKNKKGEWQDPMGGPIGFEGVGKGGPATLGGGPDESTTSGGGSTTSVPKGSGEMFSVNITLGGKNTAIKTASREDANNLVSLLQNLESDMNRTHA